MVAEDGKIHGPGGAGSPESTTTHQRTYDNKMHGEVNLRDASVQEVVDLFEEMRHGQETLAMVVGKGLDDFSRGKMAADQPMAQTLDPIMGDRLRSSEQAYVTSCGRLYME